MMEHNELLRSHFFTFPHTMKNNEKIFRWILRQDYVTWWRRWKIFRCLLNLKLKRILVLGWTVSWPSIQEISRWRGQLGVELGGERLVVGNHFRRRCIGAGWLDRLVRCRRWILVRLRFVLDRRSWRIRFHRQRYRYQFQSWKKNHGVRFHVTWTRLWKDEKAEENG